jgi:acyl dehydratase
MDVTDFTMANVPRFVGREVGTSGWIEVGQDRIDSFAACTGDEQWIHVDIERARREKMETRRTGADSPRRQRREVLQFQMLSRARREFLIPAGFATARSHHSIRSARRCREG